ncbi:hypothetical protein ACFVVU_20250 [Kitasatospora sp. NPDC057965]|uniref:hypothetical protein n=1 Tax=Kitasatospora sp. NPDC057965 TaxID=3346291 RepID=UPI0036DB9AE5
MRAKHATRGPEAARRTVGGGWRAARRWLPRPRAVAAGGALLAQLWGFGACAADAEPLPEPVGRTVGRALTGGGTAPDDPVERPVPSPSGGLLDRLADDVPRVAADVVAADVATADVAADVVAPGRSPATAPTDPAGPIGSALQDRIRAGGLPLPGQRSAVPDAFAIASGLWGAGPARTRPVEARAARGEVADGPSGTSARPADAAPPPPPGGTPHGQAAPPSAPAAPDRPPPPPPGPGHPDPADGGDGRPGGREHPSAATGAPVAGPAAGPTARPGGTATRTAAVTVAHDTAGTATAVLAPIAAGLLLTGAAMYKHRGLPKGH